MNVEGKAEVEVEGISQDAIRTYPTSPKMEVLIKCILLDVEEL